METVKETFLVDIVLISYCPVCPNSLIMRSVLNALCYYSKPIDLTRLKPHLKHLSCVVRRNFSQLQYWGFGLDVYFHHERQGDKAHGRSNI
mgnify:CR=1 FL=1